MPNQSPKVRCRQIRDSDLDAIAGLLAEGFPRRSKAGWAAALELLSRRSSPEGFPKYGYMIESGTAAVGVILLISAEMPGTGTVRCNGAAWYVKPAFRSFASLLLKQTLRHRATHMDVSPALHTLPAIEALGFKRYCNGAFAALAPLAGIRGKTRVTRIAEAIDPEKFVPPADLQLLRDHEGFGCLSLWCETPEGGYPFIFRRRFVKHLPMVSAAQLIYCTALEHLGRFAGPVGRFLALRGMPFMLVPANGPIPKVAGKYFGGKLMYYNGPDKPQLGDLAYTEVAMFGI